MRRERYAGFLGDRYEFIQKVFQAGPKLFRSSRRHGSRRSVSVIDHVPNHAVWQRLVQWPIHTHGFGVSAREFSFHPSGYAGNRKIISKNRDTRAADVANDLLQ